MNQRMLDCRPSGSQESVLGPLALGRGLGSPCTRPSWASDAASAHPWCSGSSPQSFRRGSTLPIPGGLRGTLNQGVLAGFRPSHGGRRRVRPARESFLQPWSQERVGGVRPQLGPREFRPTRDRGDLACASGTGGLSVEGQMVAVFGVWAFVVCAAASQFCCCRAEGAADLTPRGADRVPTQLPQWTQRAGPGPLPALVRNSDHWKPGSRADLAKRDTLKPAQRKQD